MIKVAFFLSTPFSIGGEQRVVSNLANYLVNNGYDVSFILASRNHNIDYNLYGLDKKCKVIFINKYKWYHKIINAFCELMRRISYKINIFKNKKILRFIYFKSISSKKVVDYINNNSIDYVIGVASNYFAMLSLIKNELKNTQIISWQHSTYESYFLTKGHRLYNQDALIKLIFNNSNYYVVQTNDDMKKVYNRFGFNSVVINNPNTFINATPNLNKNKQFLVASRFDKIKNIDEIIIAFSKIKDNIKDWNLCILGFGNQKSIYEELIKKYDLYDRVSLIEYTSNINYYYSMSSVYLSASEWEGWGMSVTEAMQNGLAIISYDIPSIREIFDTSKCGIIVKKHDIDAYAEAMMSLANDEELLIEMRHNAIERVKKFDIDVIGEKWIEILK